ncbi:DUF3060 domain-containing protein [Mycobacterium sp. URHB0044]|uniref:DUF3060 domain-containing protein n=1 Tax=Mycobacterium sp. URHB0044 TaxID=1380386 RepID=UPI0009DD69B8|nr:DUF3060 domain-containing protein [Mycobacterium sp. URHB0044]
MNPQDDPEARIRDLERPLTDMARTSELGAGQYGGDYVNTSPTPPPPPGYYGPPTQFQTAPYQAAPYQGAPRSSGGFAWWWLVVAALAIGGVVIGVGMVVLDASVFSTGDSTSSSARDRPKVSGGGGTLTNAPSSRPDVPIVVPTVEVPTDEPSVTVLAPGEPLNIGGMGEHKTVACNESLVSVSGLQNVITITGHCTSLSVSGMNNEVVIDGADAIAASGFDNRITYHSGDPEVTTSGGGNVVEQG